MRPGAFALPRAVLAGIAALAAVPASFHFPSVLLLFRWAGFVLSRERDGRTVARQNGIPAAHPMGACGRDCRDLRGRMRTVAGERARRPPPLRIHTFPNG